MKVKIINRSHHQLPEYATAQSAGVDLRANLDEPIVQQLVNKMITSRFCCISVW